MGKRLFLATIGTLLLSTLLAAQEIPVEVATAFKRGSSQELSEQLGERVELIIRNQSTTGNRQATTQALEVFFTNYPIRDFRINHQGKRDGSGFLIGTLTTAAGDFRVNCFFRKVQQKYVIHQIRIDKTNE